MYPGTAIRLRRTDKKGSTEEGAVEPMVVSWNLGEENPFIESMNGNYKLKSGEEMPPFDFLLNADNVFVCASGKELDIIRTHINNIPFPIHSKNIVMWTGDIAKFIACNFAW